MSNAEKRQALVRRLEGRARQAPPPRLQQPRDGTPLSGENAPGHQRKKSRSPGETVETIASAWAQGKKSEHATRAARALIAQAGHKKPHALKAADVHQVEEGIKSRYAAGTAYSTHLRLRQLLDHLRDHGAPKIASNRPKRPKPRATVPTETELAELKRQAQPWMKAFLILTAELGLRISEAMQASPATHNPQTRTLAVVAKGARPRVLPTTPELEILFAMAPKMDPATPYISALRGRPTTSKAVRKLWRELLRRAGANEELHPHDLRRRAAEQLYQRTRDLRSVQRLLGHDRLTSTLHYLEHYDPEEIRPLIDQLKIPTEVKQ